METDRDTFMPNGPTNFTVPEREVLERTGINRRTLRENRGAAGAWWVLGPNGRVMWSESGVSALLEKVAGQATTAENPAPAVLTPPTAENAPSEAPASAVEALEVWRTTGYPNTALILCKKPGEPAAMATALRVQVGKGRNALFAAGMRVLARLRFGHTDYYDFEGNPENPGVGARFPRWPGRW
jgi:hypothetical protein